MAKNYFTDEQVREIYYSEAGDSIEIGAFEFYKNLFNKAVEVVIGSAKAQAYVNFEGECEPAGEVEIIKFSNGSEITYLSLNNDAKVNNGDLLYTLQGFIK